MKKLLLILTVIFAVAYIAACRQTPENPVVIGKGDGQLEEKIAAQTEAPLPSDLPESGTRIQETYKHDSLNITIDVDSVVDTQDGMAMPAVKVTPHRFTQEEVDRVYDHYVGDAHFFRIPDGEPWAFRAEQNIKDTEARLNFEKSKGNYPEDFIERLEGNLEKARQNYLVAKDSSEFPGVTHTLSKENLVFGGDLTEGVYGYFEKEDAAYLLYVVNDENGMSSEMNLQRFRKDEKIEYIYEEMMGIRPEISYFGEGESLRELPYGEALAKAEETVSAFGAQSMALAHVEAKQYPENTLDSYYTFIFTLEVNGVPCIYNATGIANDEGYNDIWDYEQFIVKVDVHGVMMAAWHAPCDIKEQLTESTAMISFNEVMNCFSKMVFIKNSYLEADLEMVVKVVDGAPNYSSRGNGNSAFVPPLDSMDVSEGNADALTVGSIIVHINNIKLGLMRVQSGADFLMIPVWDFYGYKEVLTPEGEDLKKLIYEQSNERLFAPYRVYETCLLTINAIDGSVIDLEKGY